MAALSAELANTRARIARRTQSYPPDHPKVVEAKRDHAAAKLNDYIERTLAAAPPLTDEQRTRLAELLRPVRRPATPVGRNAVVQQRIAELGGGDAA